MMGFLIERIQDVCDTEPPNYFGCDCEFVGSVGGECERCIDEFLEEYNRDHPEDKYERIPGGERITECHIDLRKGAPIKYPISPILHFHPRIRPVLPSADPAPREEGV